MRHYLLLLVLWVSGCDSGASLGTSDPDSTALDGRIEDTDPPEDTDIGPDTDPPEDTDIGPDTDPPEDSDTGSQDTVAPEDSTSSDTVADVAVVRCGDSRCDGDESTIVCPADCGTRCGDAACNGDESSVTCPSDCGSLCGDGTCNGSESTVSCVADCGSHCGDAACNGLESTVDCPSDCGVLCGDGVCAMRGEGEGDPTNGSGESAISCPLDCDTICGDGACGGLEGTDSCPEDCGTLCGDGACGGNETAASCASDCASQCGDLACTSGETSVSCPGDCGARCGDGVCDPHETGAQCPGDCVSSCGDAACTGEEDTVTCPLDCGARCGDGACNASESTSTCPSDCGVQCGDAVCNGAESATSCPTDCGSRCGDTVCNGNETTVTCATDCGSECGDESCTGSETHITCPTDCGSLCGDHTCSSGESTVACPADCGSRCGDMACNGTESTATCAGDCGSLCGDAVCNGNESSTGCPLDCGTVCNDGVCNGDETSATCVSDCGSRCGDAACNGAESTATCPADCGSNLGFALVGAYWDGTHERSFTMDKLTGVVSPLGFVGDLQSWNGQLVTDTSGSKAYALGATPSKIYTLDLATGADTEAPFDPPGTYFVAAGVTTEGLIVGALQGDGFAHVATVDPVSGETTLGAEIDGLRYLQSGASYDAGQNILYLHGRRLGSDLPRIFVVDIDAGTTRWIFVPTHVSTFAVMNDGGLVTAWWNGAAEIAGRIDPRTGEIQPLGILTGLNFWNGWLLVDPTTSFIYVHGFDSDFGRELYRLDPRSGVSSRSRVVPTGNYTMNKGTNGCFGACPFATPVPAVDACTLGTAACSANATCAPQPGNEVTCTCKVGYEGDGVYCYPDGICGPEDNDEVNCNGACETGENGSADCDGVCGEGEGGLPDCDGICQHDEGGSADCNGACEEGDGAPDCDAVCDGWHEVDTADCDGVCAEEDSGEPDCDGVCQPGEVEGGQDCDGTCQSGEMESVDCANGPCAYSESCGEGYRCLQAQCEEVVQPGAGDEGDNCTSGAECAGGACVQGACRQRCEVNADCDETMVCVESSTFENKGCAPASACGVECTGESESCTSVATPLGQCASWCATNSDCASGRCYTVSTQRPATNSSQVFYRVCSDDAEPVSPCGPQAFEFVDRRTTPLTVRCSEGRGCSVDDHCTFDYPYCVKNRYQKGVCVSEPPTFVGCPTDCDNVCDPDDHPMSADCLLEFSGSSGGGSGGSFSYFNANVSGSLNRPATGTLRVQAVCDGNPGVAGFWRSAPIERRIVATTNLAFTVWFSGLDIIGSPYSALSCGVEMTFLEDGASNPITISGGSRGFVGLPGSDTRGMTVVQVFRDLNGNGLFDGEDVALPGYTVTVAGSSVTTDAFGYATAFPYRNAGNYAVSVTPSGVAPGIPTPSLPTTITLQSGQASILRIRYP